MAPNVPPVAPAPLPPRRLAMTLMLVALAIIPINTGVFIAAIFAVGESSSLTMIGLGSFGLLALAQVVCGVAAVVLGIRERRETRGASGLGPAIGGGVAAAVVPVGVGAALWTLAMLGEALAGGAWGRPLRVRGRQVHPELREGSDWTQGERPDPSGLDPATRRALEALWLHDAQKEHASVPAFARISWMLAAVGAPADLTEWAHRAALEEIAHTRLCFALAAGYGGRSHSVEPMPDLLLGGGAAGGDGPPLEALAVESLSDGCQLEDFNADVAEACERACEEPVTRAVLAQIAREERSHADFSWALLAWLLERHEATVAPAIARALAMLDRYPRPTAVSADKMALVAGADPALLRRHGRIPDAEWAASWEARLRETRAKVERLLAAAVGRREARAA
jgi:hypothetical protein